MPRGRPRKHNPTIPAHIDQTNLPRGIYWDRSGSGRWYVLEEHPEGGNRVSKTVAGPCARLSDLHAIVEERAGGSAKGTVDYVTERFHDSTAFKALALRTRKDYQRYRTTISSIATKAGPFGKLQVSRLSPPVIQTLVESIAKQGHPTKANHLLRYLRRTFRWGVNHGACSTNPAAGVTQATEARKVSVPSQATFAKVVTFARERGARLARTKGSCAPYLWICMELAYLCRLRGIEVLTLTDAHVQDAGIQTNRRKGSRDGIMAWSPRLRAAVDAALEIRAKAFAAKSRPVPLRPEDRPIIVAEDGAPLTRSGFDTAWQRLMKQAVAAEVIAAEDRFGLHAMKHRGITDTRGNRKDKQDAGGHKNERMTDTYDHELPVIQPPKGAEFSGDFSGGAGSREPRGA